MIGFAGIDLPDGYDYARAKSLVRALAREVVSKAGKTYPRLKVTRKQIGDDRSQEGARLVWLALGATERFTDAPHFTLAIFGHITRVALTIPNGSKAGSWRLLRDSASDGSLVSLLDDFKAKVTARPIAAVRVDLFQRRWPHRSAQPEWVGGFSLSLTGSAAHPVLHDSLIAALKTGLRKGNWEMQVAVDYANQSDLVRSPAFADEVNEVLTDLKPLYKAVGG
jgi:hypothetical protein